MGQMPAFGSAGDGSDDEEGSAGDGYVAGEALLPISGSPLSWSSVPVSPGSPSSPVPASPLCRDKENISSEADFDAGVEPLAVILALPVSGALVDVSFGFLGENLVQEGGFRRLS
jgi:hypothetical protein